MSKYVAVHMATAHPHVDEDGTVYNLGTNFAGAKGPAYSIVKFPPKKVSDNGRI